MPKPTKGPRLGGSPNHERLILRNLATQLFEHGRITTTEAKARRVQPLAEKLITKAKRGDLHSRRLVLRSVTTKTWWRSFSMRSHPLCRDAMVAAPVSPRSASARVTRLLSRCWSSSRTRCLRLPGLRRSDLNSTRERGDTHGCLPVLYFWRGQRCSRAQAAIPRFSGSSA